MAKKNKRTEASPRPKEFHVSPFVALKGIAVAGAEPESPVRPPVDRTSAADNGLELFLQAVADVKPLRSSTGKPAQAAPLPLQKTAVKTAEDLSAVEDGAFLEEIGRLKLDTRFADSVPDEGELQPLSGNRLRQVRRGIVSVSHQLDLHGLTREEAIEALPVFLLSAKNRGQKAVLVITGKGHHSPEAPVLHQAVSSWLRDAGRSMVLEFAPAPREMGGGGAYVVFLRPSASPA